MTEREILMRAAAIVRSRVGKTAGEIGISAHRAESTAVAMEILAEAHFPDQPAEAGEEGDRRDAKIARLIIDLEIVRSHIRQYHFDLDTQGRGVGAGHRALMGIQDALAMPWRQGAEARRRAIGDDVTKYLTGAL